MLSRARESARRAVCVGNLHQWGVALMRYYEETHGVMLSYRWDAYPCHYVNNYIHSGDNQHGVLDARLLNPYLEGFDFQAGRVVGVARCPSADRLLERWMSSADPSTGDPTAPQWGGLSYDYYGQVGKRPGDRLINTAGNDLMDKKIDANRLWMSDVFYRWSVADRFAFNHGRGGYSSRGSSEISPPPTDISGQTQLFGDGHVVWKPGRAFQYLNVLENSILSPNLLTSANYPLGWVSAMGGTNDPDGYFY